MIRVDLLEVKQRNDTFYVGKADPRVLVGLTENIAVGDTQDAQRPLEKKRLLDIAKYVGEESGIIPTSIIIATASNNEYGKSIAVKKEKVTISSDSGDKEVIRHFIELPDTKDELSKYVGTINVIDGQHRLFSFKDDYRNIGLKDGDVFEITFCLFEKPTMRARRQLFMVTNEKQKAVSTNLLLWLRGQLGLLKDDEKRFNNLVNLLNTEDSSPLKGRIIMSAERLPKGYKAKEIIRLLSKTFPENNDIINKTLVDDETKLSALCKYLNGWEKYFDVSFNNPGTDTITKISGLRYILWWFPTIWEKAISDKAKFDDSFIQKTIEEIQDSIDSKIFDISANFRGEGATDKAVKDHINIWKAYVLNKKEDIIFNPLA